LETIKKLRRWIVAQKLELGSYQRGDADYKLPYSYEYWKPFLSLPSKGELGLLLEVGCGPYGVSYFVDDSIGIDPLVGDYENAFHAADTRFIRAIGEDLPIRSGSVDSVIICNVLDHCIDDKRVLQELRRVVRKGGHIYFFSFCYEYPKSILKIIDVLDSKHPKHYDSKILDELIHTLDMKVVDRRRSSIVWIFRHALKKRLFLIAFRQFVSIGFLRGRGVCYHLEAEKSGNDDGATTHHNGYT
jgi:SAM-dependent methyltransferase